MANNLNFEQLTSITSTDEIDTILASMVDMFGRLVDKCFQASHCIESGYDETHGRNYLFANDIDCEYDRRITDWELQRGFEKI